MRPKLFVFLLALTLAAATAFAGSAPWDAVSLSAGVQGRWLDKPALTDAREFEAAGNAALGLTNHVDVTGGAAYGFNGSYVRAQADVRLCATDAFDPNFNVWIGVGRYFSKRPADGLNEAAAKAGIGWRPVSGRPFVLGFTAASGLDTGRTSLTASAVWAPKMPKGVTQ